jgi:hypothetical protein
MKPHKDLIRNGKRSGGYSIRIGKQLPEKSANLAYMSSKSVNPKENLFLEDRSQLIQENGLQQYVEKEMMVLPDSTYLLESEQGQNIFPSDKVFLTDEFTVMEHANDTMHPLYFRMEAKGRFDARGSYVLAYSGGRSTSYLGDAVRWEDLDEDTQTDLLYMGDVIHVFDASTGHLPTDCKYKIHLIRDGDEGYLYRVVVYSSFRADTGKSYKISYPAYTGTKSKQTEEVFNAYPFFEKVEYDELKLLFNNPTPENMSVKQYAALQVTGGYQFYATSQVMIANMQTRPPQTFRYRMEAKLKTKINDLNKGTLNIGVVYFNPNVYGVENLSSLGKLLANSSYKPKYFTLDNPHPYTIGLDKNDIKYWWVDLNMPAHHYYDYDVIIVTGYGQVDMTPYRQFLEDYLTQGGTVWVDNAGRVTATTNETLTFTNSNGDNTFLTNIDFSSTNFESGTKTLQDTSGYTQRLYVMPTTITDLGYENVYAKILFGSNEKIDNWNTWVKFGSGGPAVMSKAYPLSGKGQIIVSNCGIFRSLYHTDDLTSKFVMNTLLSIAENKWFDTPWKNDFVYHRDNLFEQEYMDIAGNVIYKDDRNDMDNTQIVAKKQFGLTCKGMLLPHLPTWFQNSTGQYTPVIQDDNEIVVANNDFESITVDPLTGKAKTTWLTTKANAIPGWSTVVFAGAGVNSFDHVSNTTASGVRSISITANDAAAGSQIYWESSDIFLPADMYEIRVYIKTKGVTGHGIDGAKAGIYKTSNNTKVAMTVGVDGTRNWTLVKLSFAMNTSEKIKIRLGFADGMGSGQAWFDHVQLINRGNVSITPLNDGSRDLYAYAVSPKSQNLDIKAQGFENEDVTRIQPQIPYLLVIRSFVYKWSNTTLRYERNYGSSSNYKYSISKSDGIKSYGYLHSQLPALWAGADWQDKNRVYYEITAVGNDGYLTPLINLSLYDTATGKEYFLKNGELVIGYMDLFYGKTSPTILLQAQTPYETVRVARRHFNLRFTNDDRIYLESPRTNDSRESWFIRVHNGQFGKNELGYEEWLGLSGNPEQSASYDNRTILQHNYSIPEYNDQVFSPYDGIKTAEDQVEFLTPISVRLPRNNLFVEQGYTDREQLVPIGTTRKVFEATHERWDARADVSVWIDRDGTGTLTETFTGFDIDYARGLITFETAIQGSVQVSYSYNNLHVYKRTYSNGKITNEILQTDDYKTYRTARPFLMYSPHPVLKTRTRDSKGKLINHVISSKLYSINFEDGIITFPAEQKQVIYIDYSYYTQMDLEIADYDVINGIVYLANPIDFKDDVYAEYCFEENFYEYRGYYNEDLKQFMYLDLNPSVGHYSTLPSTEIVTDTQSVTYKYLPSSQLMNKEIHIYIVPQELGGASIRHCFSAMEWSKIQQANPLCLLLGKLYVREHTDVSQVVVMDARKRGGGLSEKISDQEIIRRVQNKQRFWDIGSWNGKAYYRNGTLIIRLPKRILQSQGGYFTEEQVQQVLDRYVAYGTYMIVEYI